MRIILLGFLMFNILCADILAIHKRIIPISLLQVKNIAKKKDKVINLAIVVKDNEYLKAKEFQELLPTKIKSFRLNSKIIKDDKNLLSNLNNDNIDAIYVFYLNKESFKVVQDFSIKHSIATFANRESYLDFGILLYIGKRKRIEIKLNKEIMKKAKVPFSSKFLSVTRIYNAK